MKRCRKCAECKPLESFPYRNVARGWRRSTCKLCQQAYWREYYHRSPALIARQRQRTRDYRIRNRAYIDEYLRSQSCVDCGIDDIIVLEFDHVIGKKRASISALIRNALPFATIDAEIAKCVVRCTNCHRRRTATTWKAATRGVKKEDLPESPP